MRGDQERQIGCLQFFLKYGLYKEEDAAQHQRDVCNISDIQSFICAKINQKSDPNVHHKLINKDLIDFI